MENHLDYKGQFYSNGKRYYIDPQTGAHFEYNNLCKKLKYIISRERKRSIYNTNCIIEKFNTDGSLQSITSNNALPVIQNKCSMEKEDSKKFSGLKNTNVISSYMSIKCSKFSTSKNLIMDCKLDSSSKNENPKGYGYTLNLKSMKNLNPYKTSIWAKSKPILAPSKIFREYIKAKKLHLKSKNNNLQTMGFLSLSKIFNFN